jgi:hypothetical protein
VSPRLKKSTAEAMSVTMSAESRNTLQLKKTMRSWQCLNNALNVGESKKLNKNNVHILKKKTITIHQFRKYC